MIEDDGDREDHFLKASGSKKDVAAVLADLIRTYMRGVANFGYSSSAINKTTKDSPNLITLVRCREESVSVSGNLADAIYELRTKRTNQNPETLGSAASCSGDWAIAYTTIIGIPPVAKNAYHDGAALERDSQCKSEFLSSLCHIDKSRSSASEVRDGARERKFRNREKQVTAIIPFEQPQAIRISDSRGHLRARPRIDDTSTPILLG